MVENDPFAGLQASVMLNTTLSHGKRTELEDKLLEILASSEFKFLRGEIAFRNGDAVRTALPAIRSLVDTIWNQAGKDITDNFVSVSETYRMRCPQCRSDAGLDIVAEVAFRLLRDGPSIDDARDQSIRWDDNSVCSCDCGWSGVVSSARL